MIEGLNEAIRILKKEIYWNNKANLQNSEENIALREAVQLIECKKKEILDEQDKIPKSVRTEFSKNELKALNDMALAGEVEEENIHKRLEENGLVRCVKCKYYNSEGSCEKNSFSWNGQTSAGLGQFINCPDYIKMSSNKN